MNEKLISLVIFSVVIFSFLIIPFQTNSWAISPGKTTKEVRKKVGRATQDFGKKFDGATKDAGKKADRGFKNDKETDSKQNKIDPSAGESDYNTNDPWNVNPDEKTEKE